MYFLCHCTGTGQIANTWQGNLFVSNQSTFYSAQYSEQCEKRNSKARISPGFRFQIFLSKMDKLPVEVLEKVFEFLPRKDRKSGVLTNSLWRKAGEASRLWTWVRLAVDQTSRARVIRMLSLERLTRVEEIRVQAEAVSQDLLQAMIEHTGLKRISLQGLKLLGGDLPAGLDSHLVVEALTGVESLCFRSDPLPNHLLVALFTELSQGGSSLKKLRLYGTNLVEVPAALVASALTRMVEVRLDTKLTTAQVAALMEAVDQGDSSLKELTLNSSLPLGRSGPLNLKPLVKLEVVNLWGNSVTRQELVDFFAVMSCTSGGSWWTTTNLKQLRIDNMPWPAKKVTDGSMKVVARAINVLEKVDMEAHPYQVTNNNLHL